MAASPAADDPRPASAYLDNNATTAVAEPVLAAMLPWFRDEPGNPSSLHAPGERAQQAIARARSQVAALLGARHPKEVTFTSGATEATNLAIHAALAPAAECRAERVITSTVEHPATAECLEARRDASRGALEVLEVPVDEHGGLDVDAVLEALAAPTAMVSLLLINNETGRILERSAIEAIGAACAERGALLHLDAVQAAGKLPLDLADLPVDLASLSAHKFHGPKGVGALWVREGVLGDGFRALQFGGPQERERRAGTENVPGIVGMGAAAELARAFALDEQALGRLSGLRDRLEAGLESALGDLRIAARGAPRVASTSCIEFTGIDGEAALLMLSHHGIQVSTGSACGSSHHAPSHVLLGMGRDEVQAASSLRLSLSRETTDREVDHALATLPGVVQILRELAPRPPSS